MHILHVARIRHMYNFKGEMSRQRYKHNTVVAWSSVALCTFCMSPEFDTCTLSRVRCLDKDTNITLLLHGVQ